MIWPPADPPPRLQFDGRILDTRDGSGDGLLELPNDLMTYTGWQEGDVLWVSVTDVGQLRLERVEKTPDSK